MHLPHSCNQLFAWESSPVWTAPVGFHALWLLVGFGQQEALKGKQRVWGEWTKVFIPQLPPWQVAVVGWLRSSANSHDFCQAVNPMDLFRWLCGGSICLSFQPRGGEQFLELLLPPKTSLFLISFFKSSHTHVNSSFIRHSSNYPFWFMLLSCQNADW